MIFLRLFYEFFKTGLFAIGGGMATVPFLQEMGEKTGWFTYGDLANMIAVSESTPGSLGVNMATYVGYTVGSDIRMPITGAVIATLGLITPCILVILIIAKMLKQFQDNTYVKGALFGLRPASVGLISTAGVGIVLFALFGINSVYDLGSVTIRPWTLILAAVLLVFTRYVPFTKKIHPIYFILFSAVIGVLAGIL